jgi:hypothetical protein
MHLYCNDKSPQVNLDNLVLKYNFQVNLIILEKTIEGKISKKCDMY